ncbi:transposable element Tcb2 transposase [Trichonephila clavipes]|nr:transposable element Tcb2 transposase [Trichonephila clavipes]
MARRNHLDDFTRGRMIGKLEEGCTVTSVAAEFGINQSVVSRAWKGFQTTGTAVRKVGGGRPRTTTAGDDRYIILQAKRDRQQSESAIAQQLCSTTGRQVSWFTVARRLHKGSLFARRPERCLPLKVGHRRHLLKWYREHKNWITDQWSRVLFTDESRFSTRSYSQPLFDLERDRDPELLESEDITRIDWPAYSPDLNPIEYVWDALGRRIAARLHHPENTQQLKQILIEEWALLPQEKLHQLVLNMRRRREATIAVRGGHIPY